MCPIKQSPSEPQYFHVRATAGAKKESILATGTKRWKVAVRQKAQQGAANERIKEVLAEHLGVHVRSLWLANGATSQSKVFLLINDRAI